MVQSLENRSDTANVQRIHSHSQMRKRHEDDAGGAWVVGGGCYIKGNIRMHHFKLWMLHWGVVGIVLCTLGGGCYIKRATHACISALCISAHCGLFYFALRDRWCWQLTIESNERMHRPCSMSSAHVLTGGLHFLVRWFTDFAILQCHKSGKRKTLIESSKDTNMEVVGLANGLTGWSIVVLGHIQGHPVCCYFISWL